VRVRYFATGRSHFRMVRDNIRLAVTYGRLLVARLTRVGRRSAGAAT